METYNLPPKVARCNNIFIRTLREQMLANKEITPEEHVLHSVEDLPEAERAHVQNLAEAKRQQSLNNLFIYCRKFEESINNIVSGLLPKQRYVY